ncbi:MAG: bifunctional UDP-sugar hydrolase/5'-nucleotidase [Coprobacillus sp.]
MKKKGKYIFSIVVMMTLAICYLGVPVYSAEIPTSNQVKIEIIHTNDIHGRSAYSEKNSVFGFEKLASYVKKQNADLVIDAGDLFHGQAFATLEQGASIAELVKSVGYDVIVPGNHDWNYGQDQLKALGKQSGASLLAGNIIKDGIAFFENDGTYTKIVDGVKIGVIGVFDQDIKDDTAPRNISGLDFLNDAKKASELANKLRGEGCEIVLGVSHQLDCEAFISQTSGIDVLIAGHEHTVSNKDYQNVDGKKVKVVETGSYFQNVGSLTITYNTENDSILSIDESLLSIKDAKALTSDLGVTQLLSHINQRQQGKLEDIVGTTGYEIDGRWETLRIQETGMGRLVTAAYLKETGADIAFENAGGIRIGRKLSAGNITYRDVIDIAPFGNYIVTKQVTGKAVKSILEKSIEIGIQNKKSYDEWIKTTSDNVSWPNDNGNYLQFGGLNVIYDIDKPMGERVISVKVGNQDLALNKLYIIATNNYISEGKTYSELTNIPEFNQYAACDEALTRFIQLGQISVDEAVSTIGIKQKELEKEVEKESSNPKNTQSIPETGDNISLVSAIGSIVSSGAIVYIWSSKRTLLH